MNSLGWSDIGYNYLIGEDGNIYEGRGPYRSGAHCVNWNSKTLGFSIMGDFSNTLPNQKAIDASDQLIQYLKVRLKHYKYSQNWLLDSILEARFQAKTI